MISLEEARQLIAEHIVPTSPMAVPLAQAHGCVLAEDLRADGDYPAGDRSMMDGYVVRADAVPGAFRLVGEITAGGIPGHTLQMGETLRIFTGALVPPQGGRVVMQEEASVVGSQVTMEKFGPALFVRRKGSEATAGDLLLLKGTPLGAPELAMLAQVGSVQPMVMRLPSVQHLVTGGELVAPEALPAAGQIRDTNSTLLRALFADCGIRDFTTQRVSDDLDALMHAAETTANLLVLSGGASVGDYDLGAAALRGLGYTIHFDRVNLRPGKPLTFATRGRQAAFVLPGNPVSHFICFHTAVRLVVDLASGKTPSWPLLWMDLAGGVPLIPDPRETWWPARASLVNGQLRVSPKPWSSSGNTFALAGTNALVRVNPDSPKEGRALTLLLEPPTCSSSNHA